MHKLSTGNWGTSHQQHSHLYGGRHTAKPEYTPPPLFKADDHRVGLLPHQRDVRRETSLHEGAHLGVGLALGADWHRDIDSTTNHALHQSLYPPIPTPQEVSQRLNLH